MSFSQNHYWEASYGLGISTYWGDLSATSVTSNFGNLTAGGTLYAQYNKNSYVGFRTALTFTRLEGDDYKANSEVQRMRNLNFYSPLVELAFMMEYNLFGFDPKDKEQRFSPTLFLGIGIFGFNPKTDYRDVTVELQPLGTEGQGIEGFANKYKRIQPSIPFGAGMKIKLKHNLSLSFEILARYTLTDYIDDLSTRYVNYDILSANNGVLSANLSERQDEFFGQSEGSFAETTGGTIRGGPDVNDYYVTMFFSLRYNLGKTFSLKNRNRKGAHCPKF